MVLADEISALSASVQKLSDAVGKFVIARISQGTFRVTPFYDWNKFDKLCSVMSSHMTMEQIASFCLTSKVILSYKIDFASSFYDQLAKGLWKKASNGCLYKLDDCEKYLYVEINENFEADVQKSREKLRNLTVAHKVFDEMSDQTLSLNQNHSECLDYSTGAVCVNSGLNVDKNDTVILDDEYTSRQADGLLSGADENASSGLLEPSFDSISVENVQIADAQNLFDELPQLNLSSNTLVLPVQDDNGLIDETGELAVGSYEDFESTYELAECNIRHTRHESFEIRQRMTAKLSKLETPYFHDLVIIGAHSERFSTLTSVLHKCRVSDEITRDTNKLCGLIFQVKSKSFVALSGIHSIDFAISSVWPSLVNNVNIIWMKSQYKCFDPGVGMIKLRFFHNITIEDKGVLRGEKKIHVKYIMKLYEVVVVLSSNCILSRSKNGTVLANVIFDPGGSQRQNDFEAVGNGYIRAHESISWLYYLDCYSQSTHNTSRARDIILLVGWVFDCRRYLSVHSAGDTQNTLSAAFALTSQRLRVFPKHAPATFTWHSLVVSFNSGIMKTSNVDVCQSSIFVFDPGGVGYGSNMMSGPQVSHCGSKRPKAMRYKNHQTYVFDPGGLVMIYESNDVTKPSSKNILSLSFCLLVFFDP